LTKEIILILVGKSLESFDPPRMHKALQGKSANAKGMTDEDWIEFDLKAISTIQLCFADEILYNVFGYDLAIQLWGKLEELYMSKSLTNRLFLKH